MYVCVVCVSLCVYGRIILPNQFPNNKLINETFARPSKTLLITHSSSAKDVQYKNILTTKIFQSIIFANIFQT